MMDTTTGHDGIEPDPKMTVETVQDEHHVEERPTNRTLASLAFIAGLLSVIAAFVFLMFPPLNWVAAGIATVIALALGVMALSKKGGGRMTAPAKKFAIAGIVLGLLGPVAIATTLLVLRQDTLGDLQGTVEGRPGTAVDFFDEQLSDPPVRERDFERE